MQSSITENLSPRLSQGPSTLLPQPPVHLWHCQALGRLRGAGMKGWSPPLEGLDQGSDADHKLSLSI